MKKKFQIAEGNEIRGFVVRLYPTKDDEAKLEVLSNDMRRAWNWLVSRTEEVLSSREAYAVRNGLVGQRPEKPVCNGSPEATKQAWALFRKACAEWHGVVHKATKDVPECAFRKFTDELQHFRCKYDYQLLGRVIDWSYSEGSERLIRPGAHMLQALSKNYFQKSSRRKRFRRVSDGMMPLQVRSGDDCFSMGAFGGRRNSPDFYNCSVKINGLTMRGRLPGKSPEGRVLEGVTVRKEADGWYASVKVELPKRVLSEAVAGSVVGVDMGLCDIAAYYVTTDGVQPDTCHSSGKVISNVRGRAFAERIAGRQAEKKPVGRLHQKAARQVKHLLYNELIKPLASIETIKIEKLDADIGQRGSDITSAIRLAAKMLKERYGERVREVEPHFTSQDCSQCGFRCKDAWSYEHGRYGQCPRCGYKEHRDVNAARNIAARPAIPLDV